MPKNVQWVNSEKYKGVRWYLHETRKHGIKFDRCYGIRYQLGGKRFEAVLGWASAEWTEKKAMLAREKYIENFRKGEGPISPKEEQEVGEADRKAKETAEMQAQIEAITFGEYFQHTYLPKVKPNLAAGTYREEVSHYKNWLGPYLGDTPVRDITSFHIERLKAAMTKGRKRKGKGVPKTGLSPRSMEYVLASARQCWNHAKRDGIALEDWPGKQVKIPRKDNKRMRFLTDEEGDKLLQELAKRSQQLHDVSLLSFDTGMRAGEIFSLRWSRVDMDQGIIRIMDGKGNKNRVAFMTERVKDMFVRLSKSGGNSGLVFKSRDGKSITEISNSFNRAVDELGMNAGISDRREKLVFHSLRHSFASRLVMNNVDLFQVKELLGHADFSTTARYSHLRPETLKAAVKTLEKKSAKVVDRIHTKA